MVSRLGRGPGSIYGAELKRLLVESTISARMIRFASCKPGPSYTMPPRMIVEHRHCLAPYVGTKLKTGVGIKRETQLEIWTSDDF